MLNDHCAHIVEDCSNTELIEWKQIFINISRPNIAEWNNKKIKWYEGEEIRMSNHSVEGQLIWWLLGPIGVYLWVYAAFAGKYYQYKVSLKCYNRDDSGHIYLFLSYMCRDRVLRYYCLQLTEDITLLLI